MNEQIKQVSEFHKKFNRPIAQKPTLDLSTSEQAKFRHFLMTEEVNEYLEGVKKGDLENVSKELADILYTVYGTIIEHGLQDKISGIFTEVHNSNMSKEIKEGQEKLQKGKDYKEANIKQFFNINTGSFIPVRAVKSIIIKNNKILLLESPNGTWDLPGGLIEKGESEKEALERECWEEISRKVDIKNISEKWSFIRNIDNKKVEVQNYICEIENENILLSNEHKGYKWIKPENIKDLKNKSESFVKSLEKINL